MSKFSAKFFLRAGATRIQLRVLFGVLVSANSISKSDDLPGASVGLVECSSNAVNGSLMAGANIVAAINVESTVSEVSG